MSNSHVPAHKSAIVAATLVFMTAVGGCAVESSPEGWSAALSDATSRVEELKSEGSKLLEDAKNFSAQAKKTLEDATGSAQASADKARAALDSISEKKADAAAQAETARAELNSAKEKLDSLTSKLSGDELAKVEAERDRIIASLDSLIEQLEKHGK